MGTNRAEVAAALKTARNNLLFRGWAPGHCFIPAIGLTLGAMPEQGPLTLITALAGAQGSTFGIAYTTLRQQIDMASITVWEGDPDRTLDEVLAVIDAAIDAVSPSKLPLVP